MRTSICLSTLSTLSMYLLYPSVYLLYLSIYLLYLSIYLSIYSILLSLVPRTTIELNDLFYYHHFSCYPALLSAREVKAWAVDHLQAIFEAEYGGDDGKNNNNNNNKNNNNARRRRKLVPKPAAKMIVRRLSPAARLAGGATADAFARGKSTCLRFLQYLSARSICLSKLVDH